MPDVPDEPDLPGFRVIEPDPDARCAGCLDTVAVCDARWIRAGSPVDGPIAFDFLSVTCGCPPLREAIRGLEHTLKLMQVRIAANDAELAALRARP